MKETPYIVNIIIFFNLVCEVSHDRNHKIPDQIPDPLGHRTSHNFNFLLWGRMEKPVPIKKTISSSLKSA
jgi:hypothetical protein